MNVEGIAGVDMHIGDPNTDELLRSYEKWRWICHYAGKAPWDEGDLARHHKVAAAKVTRPGRVDPTTQAPAPHGPR